MSDETQDEQQSNEPSDSSETPEQATSEPEISEEDRKAAIRRNMTTNERKKNR